ncbi:translocation/assembly module TamB domain-containing protein [Persephonella sp.]
MKRFLINFLLAFSILILLTALVVLTAVFLWDSRKTIADGLGIQLEDDCKISELTLSCSYVSIRKDGSRIFLKGLSVRIDPSSLLDRNKPPVYLSIDGGDIDIKAGKKSRSDKRKNPLLFVYYGIYFVKSDINSLNIQVLLPDNRTFRVSGFSFLNSFDTFQIKKPFFAEFDGVSVKVEELKGAVHADSIQFSRIKAYINNSPLSVYGSINYRGDFQFAGEFSGSSFSMEKISMDNFYLRFSISQEDKKLSGTAVYRAEKVQTGYFSAENITGKTAFSGEKVIKGQINSQIRSISGKNFTANNINSRAVYSFWTDRKKLMSEGEIFIPVLTSNRLKLENINAFFNVSRDKELSVKGSVQTEKVNLEYSYSKNRLSINTDKFYLSDLIGRANAPEFVPPEAVVKGQIDVNLQDKKTSFKFLFNEVNIYGIKYRKGNLNGKIDNTSLEGTFTLNLENPDGFCFLNGSFSKNYADINITADNLSFRSLRLKKEIEIGGVFDFNGRLYGKLSDFNVNLSGVAHSFHYKNLQIREFPFELAFNSAEKQLSVNYSSKEHKIKGRFLARFAPFRIKNTVHMKDADVSFVHPFLKEVAPALFSQIVPRKATGMVDLSVDSDDWNVGIDVSGARLSVIPAGDYINAEVKGYIEKNSRNLEVNLWRKDFRYREYSVGLVEGQIFVKKYVSGNFSINGLTGFDKASFKGNFRFVPEQKNISGKAELELKKDSFLSKTKTSFTGTVSKIEGVLTEVVFSSGRKSIDAQFRYTVGINSGVITSDVATEEIKIQLPQDLKLQFFNLSGKVEIPVKDLNKAQGHFTVQKFSASKNYLYFFDSSPVELYLKDGVLKGRPVRFTGIITGKITQFEYKIKENYLKFYSEGSIDRNLLSVLMQYANSSGNIMYALHYDGSLKDFRKNLTCRIYSQELGLKTAFTIGILQIEKLLMQIENGRLELAFRGKSPDMVLGESMFNITGDGSIEKGFFSVKGIARFLPIKYQNIFQGNLNTDLKAKARITEGNQLKAEVKGKVSLSGKVKLEEDINSLIKKKDSRTIEKSDKNLENIALNISVDSYIPIYLYGKWGKAYAEFDITVEGTAGKPVVNGDVSIIYGEIYFMKNRYNIDFANIKIIQNEPYISARISTSIADTFIFIDLSGSAYDPKINFSSSPPKSKDEILSILLLRDTPSALENMPVFKTVGKILYALLPFKPSEERGLFNTGFEINILPQYSPTAGISASVYAKRSLTRRIFVFLSTPIGQVEEEKAVGWYGFGLRLKERTSFQYKFYETGNQEFDIVFTLPFDF